MLWVLILSVVIQYSNCAPWIKSFPMSRSTTPSGYTLSLVQVITRHGARSPYTLIPKKANDNFYWNCSIDFIGTAMGDGQNVLGNIPRVWRKKMMRNREPLIGNCAIGQLTEVGAKEHIDLGVGLRKVYVDQEGFLSPNLNPTEIYVRSTNIERTIESAMFNFMGLYPPTSANCNPAEAINFETLDSASETMAPGAGCQRLYNGCDAVQQTPAWIKKLKEFQPLHDYICNLWNISDFEWVELYDLFAARDYAGAPLPAGFTKEMIDSIYNISSFQIYRLYTYPEVQRLAISRFANELLQNIQDKISGKNTYKYMFFSGHDTTIAPLYYLLKSTPIAWPHFASMIIIELLQNNNNQYFLKVNYNGGDLVIDGCPGVLCPVEVVFGILKKIIPADYSEECNSVSDRLKSRFSNHKGLQFSPISSGLC